MSITDQHAEWFSHQFNPVLDNVERVIKGKRDQIATALVCLFAEGHLLLEDVPGTGKTTLAKAIANSMDGTWRRIQFTPDLLPSDVTGGLISTSPTARSSSVPARCSPTSCSPTRSTGPRRRRRRRCSR